MNSIFNPELLKFAREHVSKAAFTDPAMAAGAGGGDPMAAGAMAGPMPPMPPMGGDPAAGGAPPPGDPMAGGAPPIEDPAAAGGGGDSVSRAEFDMLMQKVDQALAGGGAGGAGAGGQKMKVDVNTEIYQLKKMMTMLFGHLDIPVPANMLLGDPAQDPSIPPEEAAKDPASAAATQGSAIGTIDPLQGASPALAAGGGAAGGGGGGEAAPKAAEAWNVDTANAERGQEVENTLVQTSNKAAALAHQLRLVSGRTRAA